MLPHFDYCLSLSVYYSIELRNELKKFCFFCLRKLLNINFHHNNDKLNTLETNSPLRTLNMEYRKDFN